MLFVRHLFVGLALALTAQAKVRPVVVPLPTAAGAVGPTLAVTPDGVALSWLEPDPARKGFSAQKWALFSADEVKWKPARTITTGPGRSVDPFAAPAFAAESRGIVVIAWPLHTAAGVDGNPPEADTAEYVFTRDHGATWTVPQPVSRETTALSLVAVHAGDRETPALLAWLDGRRREGGDGRMGLYTRVLGDDGPDLMLDEDVSDGCPLAFAPLPDGALLAYRGHTTDNLRDLRLARFRRGRWENPRPLHPDRWRAPNSPQDGPRLAAVEKHVALAWFTAANAKPAVLLALSENAGDTFEDPIPVDLGHPVGRPDVAMLLDGSVVVLWAEAADEKEKREAGLYARFLDASGELSDAELIVPATTVRLTGFPRIALVRPDRTDFIVAYTQEGATSAIRTLYVAPPAQTQE